MSKQLCHQVVGAISPHELLQEGGGMCSRCEAGRSGWGRFRKSGTMELVTLKKAKENGLNNQRTLTASFCSKDQ